MKKLGPIILGFIIGALLTYYFCPRQIDEMHTMSVENVVPKDTISVAEAKLYSNNWEKNNATEMDSIVDVEGSRKKTRSVKWSLDEVNKYLVYAKAESKAMGYTMTGVRVYLGNYGKNSNPTKKNRNTMFIVPTGHASTSKASSLNLNFSVLKEDIPVPPLNDGDGGTNGYPQ